MKKIAFLSFILLLSSIYCIATEQVSDRLIIEKDTFDLQSFPLEELRIKEKFKKSPFEYYGEFDFPHTGCYRGYIATWKVIDNKLFLTEMEKVDSTHQKLDIANYLKSNGYEPTLIYGYVLADWCSDTLKQYDYFMDDFNADNYTLSIDYLREPKKKNKLIFSKGILAVNNITAIDSYQTGDTLTKEITYYRKGFLKPASTKLEAVIKENNGKLVRVEIVDFGTGKKKAIRKIRQMMAIDEEEEKWINPRYWEEK